MINKRTIHFVILGAGLSLWPVGPIVWHILRTLFELFPGDLDRVSEFFLSFVLGWGSVPVGGYLGYVVARRIPEGSWTAAKHGRLCRFSVFVAWCAMNTILGCIIGLTILLVLARIIDPAPDSPLAFLAVVVGGPASMFIGFLVAVWPKICPVSKSLDTHPDASLKPEDTLQDKEN